MFFTLSSRDMANRIGFSGSENLPRYATSGSPSTRSSISLVSSVIRWSVREYGKNTSGSAPGETMLNLGSKQSMPETTR